MSRGGRAVLAAAAIAAALGIAEADAATACRLVAEHGERSYARLGALPDGIFSGRLLCGKDANVITVWTMSVDAAKPRLGIRDDPLFAEFAANPLREIGRVHYEDDARVTLFRRSVSLDRPDTRRGARYRVFGTLCDEPAERALDCGYRGQRIKVRTDMRDVSQDGELDHAYHQISVYDGGRKLHVIYQDTGYDPRPHALAGVWLSVLGDAGVLED